MIMSGRTGENVQAIRDRWPFKEREKFPELKPDQYDTYGDISEQKYLERQFERA